MYNGRKKGVYVLTLQQLYFTAFMSAMLNCYLLPTVTVQF